MNSAYKKDNSLFLKSEPCYTSTIKQIPNCRWNPIEKAWVFPYNSESWYSICMIIPVEADKNILDDFSTISESNIEYNAPDNIPPMPIKLSVKPFKHQVDAYMQCIDKFVFKKDSAGYALLFEMGCGKSLTAVAIAGELYKLNKVKRLLIIAPLAVCPVWTNEFQQYADFQYNCTVLKKTGQHKIKQLKEISGFSIQSLQIVVVNYETTWRITDDLLLFDADMVICDESQRIKDPTTKQSKAIHKLSDKAKYKLILTGTPVSKDPLDFFSQYRFLDKKIFGTSWYAFKSKYSIISSNINHATGRAYQQIIGYRNLPELLEKAHSIAYRINKKQALDLPEQLDQYRYCTFEPATIKVYNSLLKDSISELENLPSISTRHIIVKLLRLSQICGGFVRLDTDGYEDDIKAGEVVEISKSKQNLFKETASELLDLNKKFVVFARFTAEIHAIMDILDGLCGLESVRLIDGSVKYDDREAAVKNFQEDDNVKVFIAQIQTAGLGITLTAADTAIYYSYDYSYANYEQSKARIHRIGQKNTCTYIHLIVEDSVDEIILNTLSHKKNIADICTDNWKSILKGVK